MAPAIPSLQTLFKVRSKNRGFLIIREDNVLRGTPSSLARNKLQERLRADTLKRGLRWITLQPQGWARCGLSCKYQAPAGQARRGSQRDRQQQCRLQEGKWVPQGSSARQGP